jgi:hypothetical protein
MSTKTLSNPTVVVANDTIAIVPNSLSYKTGSGNKSIKTQSSGGDAIDVVLTENAETKKSMVKFKLYNTEKNLQFVKDWSDSDGQTIEISEGGVSESFSDMAVITEPERSIGADGELELEFEGAPSL